MLSYDLATYPWSKATFGDCELGDSRRTARLVKMGATLAKRPFGKVTQVFEEASSRQSAYRWLWQTRHEPVAAASHRATARASEGLPCVLVAVDGTSLSLPDADGKKGLGQVGAISRHGRGIQVMSALALDPTGTPLGLCGQRMWVRPKRVGPRDKKSFGKHALGKETEYWRTVMTEAKGHFDAHAPGCAPWFQMDRGADCWRVMELAIEARIDITVRASHDRRLVWEGGRGRRYLWDWLGKAAVQGHYQVSVPERPGRPARLAIMEVRYRPFELDLPIGPKRRKRVALTAVFAKEIGPVPKGQARLEWMLLTTRAVSSLQDALQVLWAYTQRWKIEDFHRMWKNGLCCIEDTQLRSCQAIQTWATLSAAVAARALRLTHLARSTPEVPALSEISAEEIQVLMILKGMNKQQIKRAKPHSLPLHTVVRWLADLGGYAGTGKPDAPPGPTVIARGLERIQLAALVIKRLQDL